MSDTPVAVGPALAVVLGLLAGTAALLVWLGRIGSAAAPVFAALRALVQLAAVSLVITVVVRSLWLTALFAVMMFGVAAVTSARRIGSLRSAWRAGAPIGAGV